MRSTIDIPEPFRSGPAAVVVPRDVIRATGPDAEAFLQGQLSQDIVPLGSGESAWSLLLHPQGKVVAWLRVTRLDDTGFLLDVDAGAADLVIERLERFKLRTACDLEPARWSIVSVRGPGSAGATPAGDGLVVDAEWPGIDGVDILAEAAQPPPAMTTATPSQLELLRIVSGVPAMGSELDERTIPAEAGIVERSVSFTKGCYTGQELVARIDSRGGNVPRRLRRVYVEGPAAVGDEIVVGGDVVGTLTSVAATQAGSWSLAYVKRSVAPPATGTVGSVAAHVIGEPGD